MRPLSKAIQRELDDFYDRLNDPHTQLRTITKGALTQSRAKLQPEAFKYLDKITQDEFYQNGGALRWGKYRLLAIDGSAIKLPRHPSVEQEFGLHQFGRNIDSPQSMGRVTVLYDVINGISLDGNIGPYTSGERTLSEGHLQHLKKDDLVIYDRLYASKELMLRLKEKQADFIFRMKIGKPWKVVQQFCEEKREDQIVEIKHGLAKFKVRLIRVNIPGAEDYILCSSLLHSKYKVEDFGELYRKRWGVESFYKTFKNWSELGDFSGKTALAVRQDFYSKLFLMNLCAAFSHPIAQRITKERNNYQINRTQSLASMAKMPVTLFIKNGLGKSIQKVRRKAIAAFDIIVSKTIDIVRPGRSFIRRNRQKSKFSMNYKRL